MKKSSKNLFLAIFSLFSVLLGIFIVAFLYSLSTYNKNDTSVDPNLVLKKTKIISNKLDTSDAKNYIIKNVPQEKAYDSLRNSYFTAIDIIAWELETYPDFETIGKHSRKIMQSSLCLANNLSKDDAYFLNEILQMLVLWQPTYTSALQEINEYLSINHKFDLPSKSDISKLCEDFNNYPVEGFSFLYTKEAK